MSKGISYTKLSEDLVPFDLYNLLRKGLQPLNEDSGEPISCPQELHKYYQIYSRVRRLDNKIKAFTIPPTDLKKVEKNLSQDGFILVPEKRAMIARLDDLTDEKVISGEYFEQLRQKDSKYRITLKEIVILWYYRTKLIEKQNKFIKQRSKIVDDDPDLISWRNLVEIKSTKQKKKFSEELEEAFFEQDEVDKLLEKNHPLSPIESSSKPCKKETSSFQTNSTREQHIGQHSGQLDGIQNCFKNEGAKWFVKFAGKGRYVDHVNGFHYIAFLLDNPNKPFRAQDLYNHIKDPNLAIYQIEDLEEEELSFSFPEEQSKKVTKNVYARIAKAYEILRRAEKEGYLVGLASYLDKCIKKNRRVLCFLPELKKHIDWEIFF